MPDLMEKMSEALKPEFTPYQISTEERVMPRISCKSNRIACTSPDGRTMQDIVAAVERATGCVVGLDFSLTFELGHSDVTFPKDV